MPKADPPAERPVTRAKNADQHLGNPIIELKAKRCTKAEMECDRALAKEKKEADARKKAEGVARVAQLEDNMAAEDSVAESAHPCNYHSTLPPFT